MAKELTAVLHHYQDLLEDIYRKHNREKLSDIPKLIDKTLGLRKVKGSKSKTMRTKIWAGNGYGSQGGDVLVKSTRTLEGE